MLEVEKLRHEFHLRQGWRRHTLVAVNDVSLRLNRGRTVAVVGESGSGKSTLGRCVVRLLNPTRGHVRLDGIELTGLSAAAFRPYQRQLQMVFQDPGEALNPRLTVAAAIDEPLRFWQGLPRTVRREKLATLLTQVQLDPSHADRYPHQLSGGQQQRVAIARALANSPSIVLADEPTGNLDLKTGKEIIDLLRSLNQEQGVTVISATHDSKMLDVSDRVFHIRDGELADIESRSS